MRHLDNKNFVHLHQHSSFSALDGLADLKKLVKHTRQAGHPAMALTDHGNGAGLIKLMKYCKDKDLTSAAPIKPICGVQFYMSRDRLAKSKQAQPQGRRGNFHITVLAKNWEGYKNLCMLNDLAWKQGFYHSPRIDFELLFKHSKGLICTTGCPSGVVAANLLRGRYDQAKNIVSMMKQVFQDDLYVQVMYHGLRMQKMIIPDQLKIARELDITAVCTNDNHYIKKQQAKSHQVLIAMATNKCMKDPNRMKFSYPQFYVKSAQQMAQMFGQIPQLITNTACLAQKVNDKQISDNLFGGMKLPKYQVQPQYRLSQDIKRMSSFVDVQFNDELNQKIEERFLYQSQHGKQMKFYDSFNLLRKVANDGFIELGWDKDPRLVQQFKNELNDIWCAYQNNNYDFATYLIVVWDIVNFAKKNNIMVGPGRGSGVGSVLLRCLKIVYTFSNPLDEGLLFERFLGFSSLQFIKGQDFGI